MKKISNKDKNKLAVSAVKASHTLTETKWLESDEPRFKIKHNLVTYVTGRALPAIVLYKTSAYTERGVDKHGWNSDSFYTLHGEADALNCDVVIFIVEVKRGVIFWQLLSELIKPVQVGKENYPQGITVQKTAQEVYFAVKQFNTLSGIPYETVSKLVDMQRAVDEANENLFTQPKTPLLDAIYYAGSVGVDISLTTVKNIVTKNMDYVVNAKAKNGVKYGGGFYVKTDGELVNEIRRIAGDVSGKNLYYVLPAGAYKDAAKIHKEPALTEMLLLSKPLKFNFKEEAEISAEKGGELFYAKTHNTGKHRVKSGVFINELNKVYEI